MYDEFIKSMKQLVKARGLNFAELSRQLGKEDSYVNHYLSEYKKGKRIFQGFLEEVTAFFEAGLVFTDGKYYLVAAKTKEEKA